MATITPIPPRLEQHLNKEYGKNKWSFIEFDDDWARIQIGDRFIDYNVTRWF